jgi:hypothetical protein
MVHDDGYDDDDDDDDDSGAEDRAQQSEAPKPERRNLHHQKDSID